MTEDRTHLAERLIDQIKGLSELDLDQLLREISQHLYKNKLEHLIDNAFQIEDYTAQIEELEDEVRDLERERDDLKATLNKIKALI